jgi:hypothetical protein
MPDFLFRSDLAELDPEVHQSHRSMRNGSTAG